MSSAAANPPSTRWLAGSCPVQLRIFSSIGCMRPRSEPTVEGSTVTTICSDSDTDDLHVKGWAETAIRHFHDPHLWIGCGGARLFLLLSLLAVRFHASFSLRFHFAQRLERGLDPLLTLSRCPFARRADAPVAGIRIVVNLALELLHHLASANQVFLQPSTTAVRSCSRTGANSHAVLRQLAQIDQAAGTSVATFSANS